MGAWLMVRMTNIWAESSLRRSGDGVGFTLDDLQALERMRDGALRQRCWSRAELVQDAALDYLAAWDLAATEQQSPSLAIMRFKKSGTYALTIGAIVVATADNLAKILPALSARFAFADA